MILMDNNITYLAGKEIGVVHPLKPYSDIVLRFLDELAFELLHNHDCISYPDITAVAFWARRSNITRLKEKYNTVDFRIGRGLAFHITPSNIPVQFIFSYMFGLLAGCANVVKVTVKEYPQIMLICDVLQKLLKREEYSIISNMTAIVRYSRDSDWTKTFSSICQARIIWGGDDTIATIRKCTLPPRAVELVLPDRYSIALLNSNVIAQLEEKALYRLAHDFYNDTFLMDQNACASPQLILWQGKNVAGEKNFWVAVRKVAKKYYNLAAVKATGKYVDLCINAVNFPETESLIAEDNILYRILLKRIPLKVEKLRGRFGLFYEYELQEFGELKSVINEKYQTLTYFGFEPNSLALQVQQEGWLGIDRIVPVGKALDMDVIWDGYDFVSELSRIIDVRNY